MDMRCPRCEGQSEAVGHEDGRAYFACAACKRVWSTSLASLGAAPADPLARVLVVDDSRDMVQLLAMWLRDEGCTVLTASSGREALAVAAAAHPDVVFLDLFLPPPDGLRVCESLHDGGPAAPEVILMTGVPNPDVPRRAADAGALAVLQKPFTREEAMQALNMAIARSRAVHAHR